jgi:DNA-binding IscR family transcriptional regulator
MRERLALNIMLLVGRAFRVSGDTINTRDISSILNIPTIALVPIGIALEEEGLLATTESEDLLPGREVSRIKLCDILSVVRIEGETGSYRDPSWSNEINVLGDQLDDAIREAVGERTLADLLDDIEAAK